MHPLFSNLQRYLGAAVLHAKAAGAMGARNVCRGKRLGQRERCPQEHDPNARAHCAAGGGVINSHTHYLRPLLFVGMQKQGGWENESHTHRMTQRSVPVGVALPPSFIPYEASHVPVGAAPKVRLCTIFRISCTLPDAVDRGRPSGGPRECSSRPTPPGRQQASSPPAPQRPSTCLRASRRRPR